MSAPQETDADAIRNKRLARLQAFQTPKVDSPAPQTGEQRQQQQHQQQPQQQVKVQQAKRPAEQEVERVKEAKTVARPRDDGLSTDEVWEDRTLSTIFRAALKGSPRATVEKYIILDGLRSDLEEELKDGGNEKSAHLSVGTLDQLILSICSRDGVVPMDMLMGAWRRANRIQRETPAGRLDEKKLEVLNEAKGMCVNYAVTCITMPDMFDGHQPEVRMDLRLQADQHDDAGLPQEVLYELVNRFDEEPELVAKFQIAMRSMSMYLSLLNMTDNYKPYIDALGRIAHIKPLAELLVNLPEFLADGKPQDLEKVMTLGPYFRLSPLQPEAANHYFSNAKSKPANVISAARDALGMASQGLQGDLAQIMTALCKASENARGKVLDFFAKVINANHKRVAMHVDHKTVASDGFMVNITAVLSRLCTPFMDTAFSKIDRIDVDYFRRNPRLDISDETKLHADDASSKEFYSTTIEGKNNFITEVFFLAVAAHHYGLGSAQTRHDSLGRDVPELERHLERIEADRQRFLNSPQLGIIDRDIARIKDRIDSATAMRVALASILMDKNLAAQTLLFMRYQMVWLLRLVDPTHQYPKKVLSLPLPEPAESRFTHLPEYMIENVGHLLSFVSIYTAQVLVPTQLTELLIFAVTFLRSSSYILKANLKSKLVEIIYLGMHENRNGGPGYLAEIVHGNPFVLQHLMHALMNIYIEIEKHYYDKFTVRFNISTIIQQIWTNFSYRERLEAESSHNIPFFVRFVALLLNDVTYVLDHALAALQQIHTLHNELEYPPSTLSAADREEKEKTLIKAEREAQSYMQLGNENVALLNLFTSTIPLSFIQPEVVDRLAGMLDYNLECLVGPRCNSLRVRNPDKYHFNPRALLSEIASVYLNLAPHTAFIDAIAKDGRSYKPQTFELALSVLRRHHLKPQEDLHTIEELARNVETAKLREEGLELELGDAPDEYLDPIMATLMRDPVILPSGTTVDSGTIKAHLLSDATDPFNRAPLKIEEVVPNVELKREIDAWIAGKLGRKDNEVDVVMDGAEKTEETVVEEGGMEIDG